MTRHAPQPKLRVKLILGTLRDAAVRSWAGVPSSPTSSLNAHCWANDKTVYPTYDFASD